MARSAITDYLQAFPFWLFDTSLSFSALPVLSPLSGFSSITAPEISVETFDITEGNWHFKRKAIRKAEVGTVTLQRGVTFSNSDFWRWTVAAVTGNTNWQVNVPFNPMSARVGGPSPRRQLVLVHFFARNPLGNVAGSILSTLNLSLEAANALAGQGTGVVGQSAVQLPITFDFAARVPARAFVLHGCLPIRYKTGTDFDARSGEISIAELDIAPELVEEISLSA